MNIELDDYEMSNLAVALDLIATRPELSPMNTGDWVRQIWFKLRDAAGRPNVTAEQQAAALAQADACVQRRLIREMLDLGDPSEYHNFLVRRKQELK